MTNLFLLGDVHFSASRPWRLKMGDSFLQWFADLQVPPDSYLLLLGDLSDSAVNPGKVIAQLESLARIASEKFKKTFILKGNHDEKMYQEEPHLSFEFFKLKPSITVLETPAEQVTIGDLNVLALPYYSYQVDLPPYWEYYSNLPTNIRNTQYDIVAGHFADTSAYVFDKQVDIKYLKTTVTVLGHIHTRDSSNYIGSIYPCKISEETSTLPRSLWRICKDNNSVTKTEIPLPTFCSFKYWDYPKPLPPTKEVTVWTINNCDSEAVVREHYKDAYIRGVASAFQKKEDRERVGSSETFAIEDPTQLFKEWLLDSKSILSRPAAGLLQKLLMKK